MHSALPARPQPLVRSLQLVEVWPYFEEEVGSPSVLERALHCSQLSVIHLANRTTMTPTSLQLVQSRRRNPTEMPVPFSSHNPGSAHVHSDNATRVSRKSETRLTWRRVIASTTCTCIWRHQLSDCITPSTNQRALDMWRVPQDLINFSQPPTSFRGIR